MANGYGTSRTSRSSRTNGNMMNRRTRRTSPPRRGRGAGASARLQNQMNQFGRTRPVSGRRVASRRAARSRTAPMRQGNGAMSPKPSFIPSHLNRKVTKRRTDGSGILDEFWCGGNVITNDCMKVQNTLNSKRNYIAQPGTGFGAKSPGTRGARRSVRR